VKGFALEINVLEGSQLFHVLVAEEPRYGFCGCVLDGSEILQKNGIAFDFDLAFSDSVGQRSSQLGEVHVGLFHES
jgi:hypothetical protein